MRLRLRGAAARAFRLPLERPIATAHGEIHEREGRLVWLEDASGRRGLGEATPLPDFGTESLEDCEGALLEGLGLLVRERDAELESRLAGLAPLRREAPCAHAALESALADLAAQLEERPLAVWLRRRAGLEERGEPAVRVQSLVGGRSAEQVADSARRARAAGFVAHKLKLVVDPARPGLEADLERVAALRESIGSEARLRLDANEAWSLEQAQSALSSLAPFGIDFVEQPVARADLDGLARLDREAPIRVAADEALLGGGVERCLERRVAAVLIVKPAALGGVLTALPIAHRAAALGLRVVFSSLLDGAVSGAASLALAAAAGDAGEVHGLGTASLLGADLAPAPRLVDGALPVSEAAGLGLVGSIDVEGPGSVWLGEPSPLRVGR